MLSRGSLAALALVAMSAIGGGVVADVDRKLPVYTPPGDLTGRLRAVTSDALANLAMSWAEGFNNECPVVEFEILGKGSGAPGPRAPGRALAERDVDVEGVDRPLRPEEVEHFVKQTGHAPTPVRVAVDAVAIVVHQENPLRSLTLVQLEAMFSTTRKRGAPADIVRWGQLGLTGAWADLPVKLHGRRATSNTYALVRELVLEKGEFKPLAKEHDDDMDLLKGVAADRAGIGYVRLTATGKGTRPMPLVGSGSIPRAPTLPFALSGEYPLARALFLYVDRPPKKPLRPVVREFVRFALSKQGQELVEKAGQVPLDAPSASKERARID